MSALLVRSRCARSPSTRHESHRALRVPRNPQRARPVTVWQRRAKTTTSSKLEARAIFTGINDTRGSISEAKEYESSKGSTEGKISPELTIREGLFQRRKGTKAARVALKGKFYTNERRERVNFRGERRRKIKDTFYRNERRGWFNFGGKRTNSEAKEFERGKFENVESISRFQRRNDTKAPTTIEGRKDR